MGVSFQRMEVVGSLRQEEIQMKKGNPEFTSRMNEGKKMLVNTCIKTLS